MPNFDLNSDLAGLEPEKRDFDKFSSLKFCLLCTVTPAPGLEPEQIETEYMQCFADLSEEWRMTANLIFRISQIDDDLLKQRLVQRMRQNIDRECFCFNSLNKAFQDII